MGEVCQELEPAPLQLLTNSSHVYIDNDSHKPAVSLKFLLENANMILIVTTVFSASMFIRTLHVNFIGRRCSSQ